MPLSILERLTDVEAAQVPPASAEHQRRLKAAIRRDLTALLNVRRAEADFPAEYEHATNSVLTFGVADFTALNLTSVTDQEKVRYSVERSIRQFEPRLSQVRVFLEEPISNAPMLHFTIEAMLQVGRRREEVSFPVALHRDSRRIALSEEGL